MRQTLARRLAAVRDDGLAVLFASHDAAFVQTVADQALLLSDLECRLLPPGDAPEALSGMHG
jgi:ABC-2 type transport system ATP-binding protein